MFENAEGVTSFYHKIAYISKNPVVVTIDFFFYGRVLVVMTIQKLQEVWTETRVQHRRWLIE